MYRIIKIDGTELGLTDEVEYIRVNDNTGNFIPCKIEEATGVAFNGVAYGMIGRSGVVGEDTVVVSKIDGGDSIFALQHGVLDNTEMLLNMQYENDLKIIGGMVQ